MTPKMTIPEKWLQPTNKEVIRQRFELPHEVSGLLRAAVCKTRCLTAEPIPLLGI